MLLSTSHPHRRKHSVHVLSVLLVSLIVTALPLVGSAEEQESIQMLRKLGKAFAAVAEKASPAVVSVRVEKTTVQYYSVPDWPFAEPFNPFEDDLWDFFFRRDLHRRQPRQRKFHQQAQGSGFIISPDGYILTNNHVVNDADKVTVKLLDGRQFTAKIVGTDPESDIGLLKIDQENLPFLELADSDAIEVGQWVIAIGNPFGLGHTVTAGIISAKGRSNIGLARYEDFIQTDAAINFGNSGGPLINLDGRVVGINTAIVGPGGNIGIGFAIPINMAKAIYPQLKEGKKVVRGFLGVSIQDLTPDMAEAFGLDRNTKGVLVPHVQPDSAAEKAGIQAGDVIVEFEGHSVSKASELMNLVAMRPPGSKVKVVVVRNGKRKTFTVTLGTRPSEEKLAQRPEVLEQLGLTVTNLSEDLARRYGYEDEDTGVIVTGVERGSMADRAGITPGTLITEVNRQKVNNTKEFNEAVKKAADRGTLLLLVKQGENVFYLMLTLPQD